VQDSFVLSRKHFLMKAILGVSVAPCCDAGGAACDPAAASAATAMMAKSFRMSASTGGIQRSTNQAAWDPSPPRRE
jgi:hypothetical protein